MVMHAGSGHGRILFWLVPAVILSAGSAIILHWWLDSRRLDPSKSLADVKEAARQQGYRVQSGYKSGKAIFVLKKDADISRGGNQPGALYIVEAASPEEARKQVVGGNRSERCLGRFYLTGDLSLVNDLFRR